MAIVRNKITCADVLDYLRSLPDECVDCVITSPPYWGLRDYGVAGQLGLEPTVGEFVAKMTAVFREVRRVLKPTGTLWLNMGDCYANDGKWGGSTGGKHASGLHGSSGIGRGKVITGLKPKDLVGQPWRLAFALREDGWWLRSDIIWHKPNPMPESVTDRPTKSHEYIFLLTKRERYFYDADAVREKSTYPEDNRKARSKNGNKRLPTEVIAGVRPGSQTYPRRNRRTVWTVATQPYSGAHFAAFPQKLVEPCLLAGCPREVCSKCGAPVVRVVEVSPMIIERSNRGKLLGKYGNTAASGKMVKPHESTTTGFRPTCDCDAGFVPGLVLDPFMGSGTVALVAIRHGRDYIGCDISPEYVEMAERRIADFDPYQPTPVGDDGDVQLSLFGNNES